LDPKLIETIAHPTDFFETSAQAFAHALRLALDTKSSLDLHVKDKGSEESDIIPRVGETLARWGLMGAHEPHSEIESKLGIEVTKVEIEHRAHERPLSIHSQPSS
jgi:hypothetical protein